jgi:drug/metabolite transporter (DMT)-like permease
MKKNIYLIVLSFFAIYFIWGSTYLLNKIAVADIPPLFLGSIRFTIAGVLIFLIAKLLKQKIAITKIELRNSAIASFFFLSFGNGLFVWALKYIDSGFASLLTATQPLIVLLMMWVLHGKKIQLKSIIGIVFGLIGIFLLIGQDEIVSSENQLMGIAMGFTCILSWSYGSIFVSKAQLPKNFFISAGYQMLFGGIILLIASLVVGEDWIHPSEWKEVTLISIALLIVFGSIVAFTAFNYLLKFISTEKVATSTYVNPVVALFLGNYFLDEKVSTQSIIATGILFLGVYFINSNKRSKNNNINK